VIVEIPWLWDTATALSTSPGAGSPSPAQTPPLQASFTEQLLPSSHAVPSGLAGFEQTPVAGAHVPASWQTSSAPQGTGFEPAHAPEAHASVRVQAFPSLQSVPSGATGFEHKPVAGAHVPG
jgi:hypothetical protein